jgi:hypothetical protein
VFDKQVFYAIKLPAGAGFHQITKLMGDTSSRFSKVITAVVEKPETTKHAAAHRPA